MVLSNDLISQFVKATKDTKKTKTESTVYATTVKKDDKTYVQIDGSEVLTPVVATANTKDGERVIVTIKNHTAIITGNLSSPAARLDDLEDTDELAKKITEFEIAIGDKVSTKDFDAESARINALVAEDVLIKKTLSATEGDINNLQTNVLDVKESLTATDANIKKLETDKLDSEIAEITYATKTEFANLEVGGRNLVAGTSETREYVGNINSVGTMSTYIDVWSGKTIVPPTDTEYIVSFDAKADVAQSITCYFYSPNTTVSSKSSTGQSSGGADGACQVSITNEWKRYWVKWTQTASTTQKSIIVGRNYTANDVYIRAVKFEVGNTPTDWTPAPEDMATSDDLATVQSSNDLVETRVTTAETLIQQLSDSIATLVTDGNGESLMTQTENGWTFSTKEIQDIVDVTSENLDNLTNEVGGINSAVNILQQAVSDLGILSEYVKITTYEGEPCIELGELDSDFKLLITNTRIMFREGTGVPAYLNNQSLFINKAVIEEELQQGEFVWKARSNGNLGLIWKGANN